MSVLYLREHFCILRGDPGPNRIDNDLTDILKASVHICIGKTQHSQSLLFQIGSTAFIIGYALWLTVLVSIQLDHQLSLVTVEINDV